MGSVLSLWRGKGSVNVEWESEEVRVERDVEIPLRDGSTLRANVFRPSQENGRIPVLVHCVPYGKDEVARKLFGIVIPPKQYVLMKLVLGGDIGNVHFSHLTPWEGADPVKWCKRGYAMVHVDARGFAKSPGVSNGLMTRAEAQDFYDVIEWCGAQNWSSGNVGTIGVSYLAITQWFVASLRPPSLKAICPWEGFFDPYHHIGFDGGIGPTRFFRIWTQLVGYQGTGMACRRAFDLVNQTIQANNEKLEEWDELVARVEDITVPALVCASFSDQGIHTRGTFLAFEKLIAAGNQHIYLFAHGKSKWEMFYNQMDLQCAFFDRFLKGMQNRWEENSRSRVTVQVRETMNSFQLRTFATWPPPQTCTSFQKLYLGENNLLTRDVPKAWAGTSYSATGSGVSFYYCFEQDTTIVGYCTLYVEMSTSQDDDLDVFTYVRKRNREGQQVFFAGCMGNQREGVTKGKFRASHAVSIDKTYSTDAKPRYTHRVSRKLKPGERVSFCIHLQPTSILFRAGESLEVEVASCDKDTFWLGRTIGSVNQNGLHTLHSGCLEVAVVM